MKVSAALALCFVAACDRGTPREPTGARRAKEELHELARARVAGGELARTDGYVYAVDLGLLMIFAAREGDGEMYQALRDFAVAHLVIDRDDDDYTRGFVVWRYREGMEPDASGTTEALRISEGLWRGAKAFGDVADRELARLILRGYQRHQAEEQGIWLIRNYFNLGTRAFATNSFLVDYAPDYVAEVAEDTGDDELRELAERSYDLVERAQAPSGLLYAMIQPEVATLLDDDRVIVFSPNDAIQVSNAATVAAWSMKGRPDVARRVLNFCFQRMPELKGTYYGRTGEIARDKRPGIEAWSPLVRMAIELDRPDALGPFYDFLVSNAGRTWRIPDDAWLYVTAELLLGLQAVAPPEA